MIEVRRKYNETETVDLVHKIESCVKLIPDLQMKSFEIYNGFSEIQKNLHKLIN